MVTRGQRLTSLVAILALWAGPAAGVVCALGCEPPADRPGSMPDVTAAHGHHAASARAARPGAAADATFGLHVSGHACGDHVRLSQVMRGVRAHPPAPDAAPGMDRPAALAVGVSVSLLSDLPAAHAPPPGPPGERMAVLRR